MTGPISSADIIVRARDINLTLGAKAAPTHILRDVDLDIGGGESVAILGPSGSGKSSLMAVLSGLERPTSGEVTVTGVQ